MLLVWRSRFRLNIPRLRESPLYRLRALIGRGSLLLAVLIVGFVLGYVSRPMVSSHMAPHLKAGIAKASLPSPTKCFMADDGSIWCPSLRPGEGNICVVPPKVPFGLRPKPPMSS